MGKRGPKPGTGGRPVEFDDEYHRVQRQKVADSRARIKESVDVKKSVKALTSYVKRSDELGIDEDEFLECILNRMEAEGESEDEARLKCEEQLGHAQKPRRYITVTEKYRKQHLDVAECVNVRMKGMGEDFDTAYDVCVSKYVNIESPYEPGEVVEGEDQNLDAPEPTPLEKCSKLRVELYGESEGEALATCQRMFTEPLIKHKTGIAADQIFEAADQTTMIKAFVAWDEQHSMKPYYVEQRKEKALKFKFDMMNARADRGTTTDGDRELKQRMNELREGQNHFERVYEPFEQFKIATTEQDYRRGRSRIERERQEVLTVGDTFKKTKTQIISENNEPARKNRLTAGSLYMRKKKGDKKDED